MGYKKYNPLRTALLKAIRTAYGIVSNRLALLIVVVSIMFMALIITLYDIQVARGDEFNVPERRVQTTTRTLQAPRGEIFDRNGVPLAVNHTAVVIRFDTRINPFGRDDAAFNAMLLDFIRMMEHLGEDVLDTLPISNTYPKTFLMNNSVTRERNWKRDMRLDLDYTAEESFDALVSFFRIDADELSEREVRQILNLRAAIFMQRYQRNPITVTLGVSPRAQAAVEERNQQFPGFYTDIEYLREYPFGQYAAHLLGFISSITPGLLEQMAHLGRTAGDIVGRDGVELAFEEFLHGTNGYIVMETDSTGRRLGIIRETPAISGQDVFLTIDIMLQRDIYRALEARLAEIQIGRLRAPSNRSDHVQLRAYLASMIEVGSINIGRIMDAGDTSPSYPVRHYLERNLDFIQNSDEYAGDIAAFLVSELRAERVTENQILLVMYEQGLITPTPSEFNALTNGTMNAAARLNLVTRMLDKGVITPAMSRIHPNTASVVVVDMQGAVLASVSYPSFNNNAFVNEFDNAYWNQLRNNPNAPMMNRPFQERRAVGSTFKMITAAAALEHGAVSRTATINCTHRFYRGGVFFARCNATHHRLNITQAIMVSCNYFFYEVALRMGINALNDYMVYFGLGQPTGVEVFDVNTTLGNRLPAGVYPISSPAHRLALRGERWFDGDTAATAIGQGDNRLTAAEMARYTKTVATGGYRYQMHFLHQVRDRDGSVTLQHEPVLEVIVPMSAATVEILHNGMRDATHDPWRGTARRVFQGFPITIGGKTGTTQEAGWPNHTAFSAFAPFDNPSIAVYVTIPGSAQQTVGTPAALVTRDVFEIYFRLREEPQRPAEVNTLVVR